MKIAILGGGGQLGSQFIQAATQSGHQIAAPTSSELDIQNPRAVAAWVNSTDAHAWINAAAYTAVDAAEDNFDAANAINSAGAQNLADALNEKGVDAPLIYLSTDYVFSGDKAAPYNELDPTGPRSVYGTTKLAGEQASLTYPNAIVLRISWVFGLHGHNFVKAILRAARQFDRQRDHNGKTDALKVVDDQRGAPCGTVSISRILLEIIDQQLSPGVYHFSNTPHVNWHEFAEAIVDEAVSAGLLTAPVQALTQPTSALNQKARRPVDGRLDATKLLTALDLKAALWRDDLRTMLSELNPADLDG